MTRNELISLLEIAPDSEEALNLRRMADAVSRKRFANRRLLLGQIGVESHGCPAKCQFCAFAEGVFQTPPQKMTAAEVVERAKRFTGKGELDALFLMAMHDSGNTTLLELVRAVRQVIPSHVKLVLNIGDCDLDVWRTFKAEGVSGAYHVLRLREGRNTQLTPDDRRRTIAAIREAGLDWFYCCEPVGPEHTNEELADAILLGNEFGCFQHAAMARVNFPGLPLASFGEISKARLAQLVAAVALASEDNAELRSVAVHEPDLDSLKSGANSVYAECGVNPRDLCAETEKGRGRSVADLNQMLSDAGWE